MYTWIFNYKEMQKYNKNSFPGYQCCIACANLKTDAIFINLSEIKHIYSPDNNDMDYMINKINIIMSHEVIHQVIKKVTGSNYFSGQWDNIAYDLEEYL